MKNETLSDKIDYTIDDDNQMSEEFVWVEDVKDFIQKLKEEVSNFDKNTLTNINIIIDKLAGDALIHSSQEHKLNKEGSNTLSEVSSPEDKPEVGSTKTLSSGTHGQKSNELYTNRNTTDNARCTKSGDEVNEVGDTK